MHRRTVLLLLLIVVPEVQADLLINNITTVSSGDLTDSRVYNVLIRGNRIAQISPSPIKVDTSVPTIDGHGRFLTPGIMDGHVHVSAVPGLGFVGEALVRDHQAMAELYLRQQPRSFLYFGVTQIVDPNPGIAWTMFTDSPQHPDYLRCEVLAAPNTFPMVELPRSEAEILYPYFIIEPSAADDGPDLKDADRSATAMVAQAAAKGARCIKLYFENGYGDADHWPLLRDDTIKAITTEAKRHNLPVLAHANAIDMYERVLRHDIDIVVHGLWNWKAGGSADHLSESAKAVLDRLRSKGVGIMPTQRMMVGLSELMTPASLDDAELVNVTPQPLLNWYSTTAAQWFRDALIEDYGGLDPEIILRLIEQGSLQRGRHAIRYLHEQGYPLLLGSDTPGSPSYTNQPGLNTYREMQMMATSGIPLADIFIAATTGNATAFGISDDYGTIESGKIANLLILEHNPLESIEAWNSIETVVLQGQAMPRITFAPLQQAR